MQIENYGRLVTVSAIMRRPPDWTRPMYDKSLRAEWLTCEHCNVYAPDVYGKKCKCGGYRLTASCTTTDKANFSIKYESADKANTLSISVDNEFSCQASGRTFSRATWQLNGQYSQINFPGCPRDAWRPKGRSLPIPADVRAELAVFKRVMKRIISGDIDADSFRKELNIETGVL